MRRVTWFFILCLLSSLLYTDPAVAQAGDNPVNVLILYADEYRFDCLGAAGNEEIETPYLDALAADGVLYNNSFCVWPVCTPSRISLMTGQYVKQHGGTSNRSTVLPGTPTYASLLRDAGYETTAVGKMHFTPAYQDIGFDTMILAEQNGRGRNVDDYHRHLKDEGTLNVMDLVDQERAFRKDAPPEYWQTFGAYVSDVPDEYHHTTWTGDRAVEAVEQWTSERGNVLMAGFLKPHHPFDPPAPWHERYDPEEVSILPGWTNEVPDHDWRRAKGYFDNSALTVPALKLVTAYYYAIITHMDHHIGRILETLKEKGLYDNTLIIFTADHGEYMGFHHMLLKGNHLYDPLAKVPLIIKYPKQKHAGVKTDELVNSLDVTATILAETGQKPGPHMRGQALGGPTPGRTRPRDVVITEDHRGLMVRDQRYKLILDQDSTRNLFFDLDVDPYELENRIYDTNYASTILEFKQAAINFYISETVRPAYVNPDAKMIDAENVPDDLEKTEQEMLDYFRKRVRLQLEQ